MHTNMTPGPHRALQRRHPLLPLCLAGGLVFAATMVSTGVTDAAHPDETTSAAIYRIPYADRTLVDVVGDAHNHGGAGGNRDRIDMQAVDGAGVPVVSGTAAASGPADVGDPAGLIVASASGIIRVIEDDHGDD